MPLLPPPPYVSPLPKIIEALDAAIRVDLESIRYWYFVCLLVSTAVVFAGLVCEIGEIWHDVISFFRRKQIEWEYNASPALFRREREPSHRVKMWAAVGWLLIVIGVGGEGVFEGLVSWTDTTLQTFNNILLSETQQVSGAANERASAAYERASENEKETAATLKQAEQERSDAAKSLEVTKGYESQIAEANARAAQAELDLAKIKEWRKLTPKQQQEIGAVLSAYGTQNFAFLVFGDPESLSFLGDINATLKIAKWNRVATPSGLGGDIGYNVDGITVPSANDIGQDVFFLAGDNAAQSAAVTLADRITKAGFLCVAHSSDWLKQHGAKMIVIRVGEKQP
jgi:hypothetical protein